MAFIVIGVLLVLAAVAGFFFMQSTKKELHAMIGTETLSIPELEQQRAISDGLGGRGGFRKVCEVVGAAYPSPQGPLLAEITKTECVWYRYRVDRQYEHVEYRDGKRRYSKRTEKVTDFTSSNGYALIDEQGRTIGVDPNGRAPDGVEQTTDRFEPYHGGDQGMELFGIRIPFGNRDSTLGYQYKEWLIRPGTRLFVLGEAHDRIGPLVLGKPSGPGHFLVSTRTEEELRASRVSRHKFLAIGVIAGFALGVVLTIVGAVRGLH
ncbi:E3 ubiquitin ligase family protein [Amycolatopsis sp. H20-H5]|uniref:E3 ubiquitin ligase family protein n=1 Tax=Amycolatopsis sp. H20-H5 TaxID=3046309 RepID=UPI002DBF3648|nr:E3 ubiquitin ligase family protein [Amycolatopsis sp. H20-H5]MEC3982027.1 E3 ubiquitin ligase family protein [Amycolatopsis sp. H20-H5]